MNHLGIDVPTAAARKLVNRLQRLKTTDLVVNCGAYREDPQISQVYIDTTWTEGQLEDWLYRSKGVEYIGVFTRRAV